MSVIQNPIVRRTADNREEQYRGFAGAQMRILKDYMKTARLDIYSRVIRLDNGVIIGCFKSFNREDIRITLPPVLPVDSYTEVIESVTGIIFHPRSGAIEALRYIEYVTGPAGSMPVARYMNGVKGGWEKGKTELTTDYLYPLVDTDKASFIVQKDVEKDKLVGSFTQPGMYGNLYWDNGATYDTVKKKWDKPYVALSWKGTPTRHFRLPGNIDIPGFSTFETSRPGMFEDTPEYTAFGIYLYKGGLMVKAPRYSWPHNGSGVEGRCLILGAMQDKAGVVYIVTQSDHKKAPKFIWKYSDGAVKSGDKETYLDEANKKVPAPDPLVEIVIERPLTSPGFFLVLWQSKAIEDSLLIDGWTLVKEIEYARNGLPWFGNVSGTEFVCGNGDKLDVKGVLTKQSETGVGVANDTGFWTRDTGHYWFDTTYEMEVEEGKNYFEFSGDLLKNLSYSIEASFVSTSSGNSTKETNTDAGKLWVGGPLNRGYFNGLVAGAAPVGTRITAIFQGVDYYDYSYCGSDPVNWIVSGAEYVIDGDSIVITGGCGVATITASKGAVSITDTQKMSSGVWRATGWQALPGVQIGGKYTATVSVCGDGEAFCGDAGCTVKYKLYAPMWNSEPKTLSPPCSLGVGWSGVKIAAIETWEWSCL